ncbi:MAG: S-adenosyl-l-methionine hydroxide adenosyltransferase family protein [Bacillota bacterium]
MNKRIKYYLLIATIILASLSVSAGAVDRNALVLQTDFGLKDGAVAAMEGVAFSVDHQLPIFSLTHEIPGYNIWEASYRLMQTIAYWPAGTVFVSVVDPGVGTDRKSVVAKTKTGQYIVTPDNGTLTLIADSVGIAEIRKIDETKNRLKNSNDSYTFYGRDVYAYTGARLASGTIAYTEIGPLQKNEIVRISYQKAVLNRGVISGNIPVLDIQYGNVWTNIGAELLIKQGIKIGDNILVNISSGDKPIFQGVMPYVHTFGDVPEGKPLAYMNSLMQLSFALNMKSFSEVNKVYSGPDWVVTIDKAPAK